MIVDTSALIAILRNEPDARSFATALAESSHPRVSAANWLEAAVVMDASGDLVESHRDDDLVSEVGLEIVAVTAEHVVVARAAYRDFGKGSGHPARLNFDDCFVYALARLTGEPLLYTGSDSAQTDISVWSPQRISRLEAEARRRGESA